MTTWTVGFAREEITPEEPLHLAGFAARVQPATGTHDPLFVRAIVVGDGACAAALCVLDVIGVDGSFVAAVRERVRSALGDAVAYTAVAATHTHGGPAVLERALLGDVDATYRDGLIAAAARTIVAAHAAQRPTRIRFGMGTERTVGRNRRDPAGPTDPDLPVVRFDDPDTNSPIAVLCAYACHPVTLGPDNRRYTRDYPGFVVAGLEQALGGVPVLFATGCCGQINTGHSAMDSILGRASERRTFAEARRIGLTLTGAALHAVGRIGPPGGEADSLPEGPLRTGSSRIRLPIVPALRPDAGALIELEERAAALADAPERLGEAVMAAAHLHWARTHDPTADHVETEVGVNALGSLAIVLLPGEIFVELGLEIKRRFAHLQVVTVSYANDAIGYLPNRGAHAEGGYEVELAYRHYGFAGPYAERAGDVLVDAVEDLVRRAVRPT